VNIPNYGLLNPKPSDPAGYVTKDGMWAAVPYGNNKFVIIHDGQQVHTANSYSSAKTFIQKQIKTKKKKSSSNLEKFL
jgi:hypothetical protein